MLKEMSSAMDSALECMQANDFSKVTNLLKENENIAREIIQKMTSSDMQKILKKLDRDETITEKDAQYIELWLMGDAQSYVNQENNFQDWIKEFKRLKMVLKEYEGQKLNLEDSLILRGILEDARRLTPNIANFLEKKERIEQFKEAIKDPQANRKLLKGVLEAKLSEKDI